MATRQLANRRIRRVRGARNTRVDAGKGLQGSRVAPARPSNLRTFPIDGTGGVAFANILATPGTPA
jgi:hypothetical protein